MSGVSKSPWLAMLMRTPRPVAGGCPFGDDGADDRQRDPHPQAAEDHRQGRRDLEGAACAARGRAEAAKISSSRGSAERMPTIVAIVIGKKTMSAQTTTRAEARRRTRCRAAAPAPASAPPAPRRCRATARARRDALASAIPTPLTAVTAPTAKPRTTSNNVRPRCCHRTPGADGPRRRAPPRPPVPAGCTRAVPLTRSAASRCQEDDQAEQGPTRFASWASASTGPAPADGPMRAPSRTRPRPAPPRVR